MTEAKNQLRVYHARKLYKGAPAIGWVGLVPPILPPKERVDRVVEQMVKEYPEISSINRPDDGHTPPSEIENFHVTYVAAIEGGRDGFDKVNNEIKALNLSPEDLVPKRDAEGDFVFRIFQKDPGGTVFAICEFEESEKLRAARLASAKAHCGPKYTVHPAHVTVAYGNSLKKAPPPVAVKDEDFMGTSTPRWMVPSTFAFAVACVVFCIILYIRSL